MDKLQPRHGKYFLGAFFVLFFLAGKPVEFGQENAFFQGFLIENPVIRVGLGVNLEETEIHASAGMKVYEVGADYRLLAEDVDEIHIKGRKEKLTEKFSLQVVQTSNREEAEKLAADLKFKVNRNVYIVSGREGKSEVIHQVRVGDFMTRAEALGFIRVLNKLGLKDAWILREEVTEKESHALQVLVGDELKTLNEDTVIYFIPVDARSFLSYNGSRYRGIFVLRASPKGLVLVNVLNLEDYLKGVVPKELSPDLFNAFDALKAQAVAARTYAIRSLGANRELGFDLYDTPQSQVYGGLSAEHPLSNRAVDQTKGEVAVYKGKLINALYTSTCGGMTEDIENIFEGESQPYLKSTECAYENQPEWTVESRPLLPIWMTGRNIQRETAVLMSLGVIPEETNPLYYREPVPFGEATSWINAALALVGKRNDQWTPKEMTLNFPNLTLLLIEAFQWEDRVKNLMLKSEVDFVLRDLSPVKGPARDGLAYLINSNIFPSSRDLADESRLVTRGDLAFVLFKAIRSYFDPVHKGIVRGLTKRNELEVDEDGASRVIPLTPNVFLFRNQDGEAFPASKLTFLGGEDARWVEFQGEGRYLEVYYPSNTATLDRGSPVQRWQLRQAREELEKRINEYYPIGQLKDIVIERRGKSHRVIELTIVGTESQVVVKGLKIRWVLGLRDTLFTMDKEFDDNNQVTHFVFSGKGWGHGVGLCQVGAFRMAQAGADYKDILKKYYQDIKIIKYY
jgi:stage II sporulation protein D